MSSLNEEIFYEIDEDDFDDKSEEIGLTYFERRQMKQVVDLHFSCAFPLVSEAHFLRVKIYVL